MPGKKLYTETQRSNLPSPYLPKNESEVYQQMYSYYESLGDSRSLQRVAEKFRKSRSAIALVARAFQWADRIENAHKKAAQDPLLTQNKPKIDSTRKKLISVVEEVADTLHEIGLISRAMKRGELTPEQQVRLDQLHVALSVWGFEWKSPKDFRSLMQTLREVKEFAEEPAGKSAPTNATQINTEKFELHIKD